MTARPHDAIFKAAFETPEHAAAIFRSILPPALCDAIAWSSLTRESGSFIDPELRDYHTDLLFSAQLNGGGDTKTLLYLLLEHQSTSDRLMPLRMLAYLVRVWELYEKHNPGWLPLLVPVLISHAPGGWRGALAFHELFEPPPSSIPGLADHVPRFSLLLEDLAHLDNEELRQRTLDVFPKLVLWLLRDARDATRLLENLTHWAGTLREVADAPNGMRALTQLLQYVTHVGGDMHVDQFYAKLCEQVPQAKEVVVTFAEQLQQRGWEKGRVEGIERGRVEGIERGRVEGRDEGIAASLEKLLTLEFGELSPAHAQRLWAASGEELEGWIERVLAADTVEAVFAEAPPATST